MKVRKTHHELRLEYNLGTTLLFDYGGSRGPSITVAKRETFDQARDALSALRAGGKTDGGALLDGDRDDEWKFGLPSEMVLFGLGPHDQKRDYTLSKPHIVRVITLEEEVTG